ncbi:hypothetical protein J422_04463 [Methanocaldococcus villosus KIN24-T80]|uniref:Nitrogen regulatory protein P-II n=1 Tax=Methanocaldococcus villosus KIN24-T80 TaxID=1069083 RepID=N6VYA5_9EURY|nr:MJ1244 family protein [Methanocaldococcus villosus]ENN96092.1 hypothetical protein J422_04463 [Methanocaldococcus villosus KIN24-T80]
MKILFYLFVESENIGKAINALSEGGITGFFLYDYKGMSPEEWKGFLIDEDPEKAIKAIQNLAKNAILIGTVIDEKKAIHIEKAIKERLKDCKYTIIQIPVLKIEVNYVGE